MKMMKKSQAGGPFHRCQRLAEATGQFLTQNCVRYLVSPKSGDAFGCLTRCLPPFLSSRYCIRRTMQNEMHVRILRLYCTTGAHQLDSTHWHSTSSVFSGERRHLFVILSTHAHRAKRSGKRNAGWFGLSSGDRYSLRGRVEQFESL